MSKDKMREEFEVWATENGMGLHLARSESGLYVSPVTQKFLGCWVASRAAVWHSIDTCPQHQDVLFFRADAGVFAGMITDADHFMSDKERDEWDGTEEEMSELDAFGYGDWGVCRCDGSERPTHWMPLPAEPEAKP